VFTFNKPTFSLASSKRPTQQAPNILLHPYPAYLVMPTYRMEPLIHIEQAGSLTDGADPKHHFRLSSSLNEHATVLDTFLRQPECCLKRNPENKQASALT